MPQDDRRPNLKVSEFANTEDKEMCVQCGTLIPFSSVCPICNETHEQIKNHFTLFKRE
jgi:rubrerythrin